MLTVWLSQRQLRRVTSHHSSYQYCVYYMPSSMLNSLNRLSPDPCTDREEAEQTPLDAYSAFIHLQDILFRAVIYPSCLSRQPAPSQGSHMGLPGSRVTLLCFFPSVCLECRHKALGKQPIMNMKQGARRQKTHLRASWKERILVPRWHREPLCQPGAIKGLDFLWESKSLTD